MLRVAVLSTTLSLSPLVILAGQAGHSPVEAGARVRITASWSVHPVIGTVVAIDRDSLRIHPADPMIFPDHPTSVAIALSTIRELEVAVKGHSNTGKGALIGLGIGALGGAVAVAASCQADADEFFTPGECAAAGAVGALIFGALGAGLGALIGSSGHSEHWERVTLDQISN